MMMTIVETLRFGAGEFRELLPSGQIHLDSMRIAAPQSRWCQRVWLALMCGMAGAGKLTNMELQVIGHFGEQLDYTDRAMARVMRSLADTLCEGRLVHILEGGYALSGVRDGTRAVLESLLAEPAKLAYGTEDGRNNLEPGSVLKSIVDNVFEVHGRRIPNLGAR